MMKAEEIINILKKNKLLERRTFTQVRSDTLPMGEGGKGENRNFPLTIVQRSVDDEC